MQLRPQIQIQTIIKAMMEDVIPALDQTNQLAMQSAQLTIGTLTMIAQHLPLEYRYDCDELARLIDAAAKLREQAQGGTQTEQAVLALRAALEGVPKRSCGEFWSCLSCTALAQRPVRVPFAAMA